jgi:hypothetical protein
MDKLEKLSLDFSRYVTKPKEMGLEPWTKLWASHGSVMMASVNLSLSSEMRIYSRRNPPRIVIV